jgi:hypothetical protein
MKTLGIQCHKGQSLSFPECTISQEECYGLILCQPLPIHSLKPNQQRDHISRWNHYNGSALMNWITAMIKEALETHLAPSTL